MAINNSVKFDPKQTDFNKLPTDFLVECEEWNGILVKIHGLKFEVPIGDKFLIMNSKAPIWLKNIVFTAKIHPSC